MATQCFLVSSTPYQTTNKLINNLRGSAVAWEIGGQMDTARGSTTLTKTTNTVAGPTAGVEVADATPTALQWISFPLSADQTISGSITFNLWAAESNMNANVAINAKVERMDAFGEIVSTIVTTARTIEVAITTPAVNNFTATPTSTNMLKGDRFRVTIFGDDAGTMGSGFTFSFTHAGPTAGASGDSYITFNETFSFITADPAGTVMYPTDTASDVNPGAAIEKAMWTSRGGGVATAVVNTVTGWTTPVQYTNTAGGTAVEWYTPQLQAFTLGGAALLNLRAITSNTAANTFLRAEIAVCAADGTLVTEWAAGNGQAARTLPTVENAFGVWYIVGDDLSVTEGQRLRLRLFLEDLSWTPAVTGHTNTILYAGAASATGDTFLTLTQTVAVSAVVPRYPAINHQNPAVV